MKNNYYLSGFMSKKNNYGSGVWVNFPLSPTDRVEAYTKIGLDYEWDWDDIVFTEWKQSDNILDLGRCENIDVLNDIVDDINSLSSDDYRKLLAIIEVEGTINTFDAEMFGLNLDMYNLYNADELHNTKYGVLQCL